MRDPQEERGTDGEGGSGSRRPALFGLLLVLALVVGAYFLVGALQRNSALEDCLMSGRRNCAPIEVPPR